MLVKSSPRPGVVLLAVLVVVALLIMVAYQFGGLMKAEFGAAQAANQSSQGRALADSGVHYAAFVLSHPEVFGVNDGEDSLLVYAPAVYDSPELFQNRPVLTSDPERPGYFTILAPRDANDAYFTTGAVRYGVIDESAKININALRRLGDSGKTRDILQKLPNMTPELADAIINWTGSAGSSRSSSGGGSSSGTGSTTGTSSTDPAASSNSSSGGSADAMYYASMGYAPKGGPFESLEEMLLVRGVTPRLLLGNDLDHYSPYNPGLSRYFTIYSREKNVDSTGQPRIKINDNNQDLNALYEELIPAVGEDLANFIMAYKVYGTASGGGGGGGNGGGGSGGGGAGGGSAGGGGGGGGSGGGGSGSSAASGSGGPRLERGTVDVTRVGRNGPRQLRSLLDLIDAQVDIQQPGQRRPTRYPSPLQSNNLQTLRDLLPALMDKVTTSSETDLPPRININTAPPEVLAAIPGLEQEDVQAILDYRAGPNVDPTLAELYRTPAWLITEAGFDPDTVDDIASYITTRSQVYRVQVIGYYDLNGPMTRLEAVIDTNAGRPQILYWRDLTELGRGNSAAMLGR